MPLTGHQDPTATAHGTENPVAIMGASIGTFGTARARISSSRDVRVPEYVPDQPARGNDRQLRRAF